MTSDYLFGASGTSDDKTVLLVVLAAFAVGGYRISARHELLRGRTPWGFPSIVWALICFLTAPFGLLVELFAARTTPPVPGRANLPRGPGFSGNRFSGGAGGQQAAFDPAVRPAAPLPESNVTVHLPLFGWYPDVTGRHEFRYWDGKHWSELVADQGQRANDPLDAAHPPPVIAPKLD